jgi:DNA polymerase-3 subunit beta
MKLVCAQNELSAKLSLLSRVVPSNPTHPVLANVLLTAEPERLGLTVFDLSLGMQVWIPAQAGVVGSITLPARFLNDIVSRLPNTSIEVESDGPITTLTCASGHYQMQGIEAEEFPALPELETVEPLTLPVANLLEGLRGALFAASTDETKQILTGLHLSAQADYLEFAATDGHRLAVTASPSPSTDDNVSSRQDMPTAMAVTIPARALRELERMLGRSGSTPRLERSAEQIGPNAERSPSVNDPEGPSIAIRFDPTQIVFEFAAAQGAGRLSCRLLEGQYPNYHQLIPRQFARQITVERQLLLGASERIAVLAIQRNNIIKLKLDHVNQQIALSAEAPQFGSGEEFLPAQISGDDLEIAFNVRYLIDGLKAMNSSEIQLQLNTATTPAVISPLVGQKMAYLIMPIQVRA